MTTNGSKVADADMADCDGEKVVTMMDVLQEQQEFEEDANAVLGASDDKNCTYPKGYIKRQAIYACQTCCTEAKDDPSKRAGVCLACSLTCHENHELIELYTKRNFRCDCGNPKFNSHPCQYTLNKSELNEDNQYNQNFSGLYCVCHRPYPDPEIPEEDEMIQCIICEDWLHSSHLEGTVPGNDQYAEMICKACMETNNFLHDYSEFAVNAENEDVEVTINGNDSSPIKETVSNSKSSDETTINGSRDIPMAENETNGSAKTFAVVSEGMTDDRNKENTKDTGNTAVPKEKVDLESKNSTSEDEKTISGKPEEIMETDGQPPEVNKESSNTEQSSKETGTENNDKDASQSKFEPEKNSQDSVLDGKKVSEHIENKHNINTSEDVKAEDDKKHISSPETSSKNEPKVDTDTQLSITQTVTNTESGISSEFANVDQNSDNIADEKTSSEVEEADTTKDTKNDQVLSESISKETETSNATKINEDANKSANDDDVQKSTNENKRKLSTEETTENITCKKLKVDGQGCVRPKGVKRIFKGATFWASDFRQKLCTCNECISMYKDLAVLYLIDLEDTVTAYETLGMEKIDGTPTSQYEKGLEALSSLGRVQQINALTEYNKMKDKLLDFLKSFKDRKEIVKEEDIKSFFAGMKPKREPDGVYFCR